MIYRWYQLPARAVLLVGAMAKSFLDDWFPPHTCENCEWSEDKGLIYTMDCCRRLGRGYGVSVWKNGWCKHWKKRKD